MVILVSVIMTTIGLVMIIGGPNLKVGGDFLKAFWVVAGLFMICCAIAIATPSGE